MGERKRPPPTPIIERKRDLSWQSRAQGRDSRWQLPIHLPRLDLSGRTTTILLVVASLCVVGALSGLYATGYLNPFPRVSTLSFLPPLPSSASYSRVVSDSKGWVWVAQSAPGTAATPNDSTLLTVIDPDTLLGNATQARLCFGCAATQNTITGKITANISRVDDIAPDPKRPHSVYIAAWTTATDQAASFFVIYRLDLAEKCQTVCAKATPIMTGDTLVGSSQGNTTAPLFQPLLSNLVKSGVTPLAALATASNGDLYLFLSDRGSTSLSNGKTNVVGGYQGLLRYDLTANLWITQYTGPSGNVNAQRQSPTSTITAIAVAVGDKAVFLADSDHHAIYRLDLTYTSLGVANPFTAAGGIKLYAGEAIAKPSPGVDTFQAAPGDTGDGGLATKARLNVIRGLTLDANGDLLASDAGSGRIRLITPKGIIWTVGGRGAPAVDGDNGSPQNAGLRGIMGIAAGTRNRLFIAQGAATDNDGRVRLRVLNWGWSTPQNQTTKATQAGQSAAPEMLSGLLASHDRQIIANIIAASGCPSTKEACVAPYLVTSGNAALDQFSLAIPGPVSSANVALSQGEPLVATRASGTNWLVMGMTGELAFAPAYQNCCGTTIPAAVSLPSGSQPTGIAVLMPTTDTQLSFLGAAYILVATQNTEGSALLVYKATADTCGLTNSANCAQFPGTPTLALSIPLAGKTSGDLAASLSDDGKHAFALVSHPGENQISAIDLSGWFTTSTAPSAITQISVSSPGAIALRHDGLAAYIGSDNGQIAVLATQGWLSNGVPTTSSLSAPITAGDKTSNVVKLALTSDDTCLYAATNGSSGTTTLITLTTGQFNTPATPKVNSKTKGDAHLIALSLSPDDQRLVTLSAPNGEGKPTSLRAWATRDPAAPDQWLSAPLDLGAASAPAKARLVVAAVAR